MEDQGDFEQFILLLDHVDQRAFRALASGRGIPAAAQRAGVSEDYVRNLCGLTRFRAAVAWGMDFPDRREAALEACRMVDARVLPAAPSAAEATSKRPHSRRRPPAGSPPDKSARRPRHIPAPVTETVGEPEPGQVDSGDDFTSISDAETSSSGLASGEGAAGVPNGPSKSASGPAGGASPPGLSRVDTVPPEPHKGPSIAAATDGGDQDDPSVAEEGSPGSDQAITTKGVPEGGQDANEVESARPRTWTDDDLRSAASALVRLRDQARAESSLELASGDLDDLLHSRAFVRTVAKTWLSGPHGHDALIEFGTFLRPNQRRAAESLADGMKKQDAAESVGRHRDTLHQWEQDPVFQAYVKQVEIRSRQEQDRERRARQEALQANVFALCEDVVETLRPAVHNNPKVALAALSHLSKRILGS